MFTYQSRYVQDKGIVDLQVNQSCIVDLSDTGSHIFEEDLRVYLPGRCHRGRRLLGFIIGMV